MKAAVVTGSNKGIGRGIIQTLYKLLPTNEWTIYLTSRNVDLGKQTLKELETEGVKVSYHQLDINCAESRRKLKEYLVAKYGGLDILVNNAGILYMPHSTTSFAEQAEETLKTNFFSTLKMCEEFIPILRQNARIVNISSEVSHWALKKISSDLYSKFVNPMTMKELVDHMNDFVEYARKNEVEQHGWTKEAIGAYGVSKLGLTKMTFILAEQLKGDPRNIVINCCCPGYVATDLTDNKGFLTILQGADTPSYLATLPLGTKSPYGQFLKNRQIFDWK